jgi:putative hydrolase of the HAD superfamily
VPCRTGDGDLAHHLATRALDAAGGGPTGWQAYVAAWCLAMEVPPPALARSMRTLRELIAGRSDELWVQPRPGAHAGLQALADTGVPIVIVSNSDGLVADILVAAELCQAGAGPATEVLAVLDSHLVGSTKPDAGIFLEACRVAGVDPHEAVHVGDTVTADVVGALGAGVRAIHLDPHGLCDEDHDHAADLLEVAARVAGSMPRPAQRDAATP